MLIVTVWHREILEVAVLNEDKFSFRSAMSFKRLNSDFTAYLFDIKITPSITILNNSDNR